MPRYFFHLDDGESDHDLEGTVLADAEGARDAALRFLSQSLVDRSEAFWASPHLQLSVSDESGEVLFTVTVAATDDPVREITIVPMTPA